MTYEPATVVYLSCPQPFLAPWISSSGRSGGGGGEEGMVLHTCPLLAQIELHMLACLPATCTAQFPMGCGPVSGHGPGVGDPWFI